MNIKDVCKSVCIIIMSITIVCISSLFIVPIRTYNVKIIISKIVSIMFIKIIWLIVIKSTLHKYMKRPSSIYDIMKMTTQCPHLAPEVTIFANNNILPVYSRLLLLFLRICCSDACSQVDTVRRVPSPAVSSCCVVAGSSAGIVRQCARLRSVPAAAATVACADPSGVLLVCYRSVQLCCFHYIFCIVKLS